MNAIQQRYGYEWSADEYAKSMAKGWGGGLSDGTPCGSGSTLENTQNVRKWLPVVFDRYAIRSVCDAGAGDLHWISKVPMDGIDYRAFDLVPRHEKVERADITAQILPKCDLILCRHVLNHMAPHQVFDALDLFSDAARFLIATQHPKGVKDMRNLGAFNGWDLSDEPFGLPEPLETIDDCNGYQLSLWRLK